VNPDHLYLGTQRQNMRDMVARGRQATRDRAHGTSKITTPMIAEIRALKFGGMSQTAIAKRFNVCQQLISRLLSQ
jgi:IS30 family transposase